LLVFVGVFYQVSIANQEHLVLLLALLTQIESFINKKVTKVVAFQWYIILVVK